MGDFPETLVELQWQTCVLADRKSNNVFTILDLFQQILHYYLPKVLTQRSF